MLPAAQIHGGHHVAVAVDDVGLALGDFLGGGVLDFGDATVFHADPVAPGRHLASQIAGGADGGLLFLGGQKVFQVFVGLHALFQGVELGELSHKLLVFHRVQRVLVFELGDQQHQKGIFVHFRAAGAALKGAAQGAGIGVVECGYRAHAGLADALTPGAEAPQAMICSPCPASVA